MRIDILSSKWACFEIYMLLWANEIRP